MKIWSYRMEKWCSPYLTTISRAFCGEEYVLDTGDLIKDLEEINELKSLENENVNLFTLDVEKLYPSIQPELAMQAIQETLAADRSTDRKTKAAIEQFIRLSFENSYVTYQNECFKSKVVMLIIKTGTYLPQVGMTKTKHKEIIQTT